MKFIHRFILCGLCLSLLLSGCALPTLDQATPTPAPVITSAPMQPTATPEPPRSGLWLDPSTPAQLAQAAAQWNLPAAADAVTAAVKLELVLPQPSAPNQVVWVYALVAPFPTILDDVSSFELRSAWSGTPSANFGERPLLMTESTLAAFTALWGAPAAGAVRALPADKIQPIAWYDQPAWAIVPFEDLNPQWKVLSVDGQSPVRKDFDSAKYPLLAGFRLSAADATYTLPATNRDANKLTTVILTGVTALVRATAKTMEIKGVLYPGQDIRNIMREADIAHVSNEIPFYTPCSYPNPSPENPLVFCSSPKYMDLLTDIGTDVIELTGNHFGDYGAVAMFETLEIYARNNIPYYGGGKDVADAVKPLRLENHGNKIAFIGCNPVDTGKFPTATSARPGAAPCDYEYMTQQISELTTEGYVVITTFQYHEYYSAEARPWQVQDFHLMADAGAAIVSGSQAHYAQVMEFHRGSFIHYGLGNLFFDQMGDIPPQPGIRRLFMDRHVIYDGRYISTELLTGMMEDYSRPRPMTPEERAAFLQEYFALSNWIPAVETPTPGPTPTLTPYLLPSVMGQIPSSTPGP
jgi:poly-gamma-glutamate synthesis protein (capsule biosynthesis protein)